MKKLLEDGFIHRSQEGYITLTDKGEAIAREIYARHRFFSCCGGLEQKRPKN